MAAELRQLGIKVNEVWKGGYERCLAMLFGVFAFGVVWDDGMELGEYIP